MNESLFVRYYRKINDNPEPLRLFIYCSSVFIRLALIAYSSFHNLKFDVKYTDIDYLVFSDASKLVLAGKSPYLRHTYRYTPILSYLMVFNHYLFNDFGKLLFTVSDLLVGLAIEKTLSASSDLKKYLLSALWLLNPFVIAISSRGNADTIICLIIISSIYFLKRGHISVSALLFGLSVHFKLYPVIYALPVVFHLYSRELVCCWLNFRKFLMKLPLLLITHINFKQIRFAILSFLSFAFFTYLTFYLYGFESIYESYLYHYVRKDHRHNFSLYFNLMYYIVDTNMNLNLFVSFVPQVFCFLIFSLVAFVDLTLSLFLMTISFVSLNKVLTSQHFLWWICLLPLVLSKINLNFGNLRYFLLSVASVFVFKFFWLFCGYRQEFLGYSSFNEVCGGLIYCLDVVFINIPCGLPHACRMDSNIQFLQQIDKEN
ncbi:mannosyltransferase, putative [Theileria annulata]|uniref:GPI mannosyltransferase 1 n=1 Tax=Theileria annulata TaxID=5874 RepID=Q4U9E9_THEAN|nr:mannosyltransferase, putative [Theileria annulata]CAI76554.1 mannosyltransferase, putative [Theileria annulata]|eukprot:XP_953179.1 mannosyltransferase, putative [Theileria annulata]